jgi:hypothetical protein
LHARYETFISFEQFDTKPKFLVFLREEIILRNQSESRPLLSVPQPFGKNLYSFASTSNFHHNSVHLTFSSSLNVKSWSVAIPATDLISNYDRRRFRPIAGSTLRRRKRLISANKISRSVVVDGYFGRSDRIKRTLIRHTGCVLLRIAVIYQRVFYARPGRGFAGSACLSEVLLRLYLQCFTRKGCFRSWTSGEIFI